MKKLKYHLSKNNKGFIALEALLGMILLTFILSSILNLFNFSLTNQSKAIASSRDNIELAYFIGHLKKELREAQLVYPCIVDSQANIIIETELSSDKDLNYSIYRLKGKTIYRHGLNAKSQNINRDSILTNNPGNPILSGITNFRLEPDLNKNILYISIESEDRLIEKSIFINKYGDLDE